MSDRKSCVRCGRTIDAAARLCPFCNWDQEAPVPAADPNAAFAAPAYVPPEETAWRKYVFGGIGAVVLVLLAFVVGAQLQKRKNVTPPVPKGSPAATDTAPAAPAPAAPSTNVTLVPDNSPVRATTDQAYTSAPVSSTAQGLASQTDRADATAVSSSEYAQMAQRAAAEAAQRKKMNALVDPRSISGQPYGSAPAPAPRHAPTATLAQQMPGMTSAAPPSMVPASPAVVRVGPIPERQPMPVLRGRQDMSAAVEVTVAPDGHVTDVNVLQPLPGDDTARLIAAVQNWQFRPATENGVPVASRFRTTLFFHAHER
jgi:TonB family protein